MKIEFQRMVARNYGPYKEIDITFKEGKHGIVGANLSSKTETDNGTGKSSIPECFYYTITGKNIKNLDPSHNYEGDCETELSFTVGGSNYAITRYFKHKKFKNSVIITQDGNDISSRIKRDTQRIIDDIIAIPDSVLSNYVVMFQGSSQTLVNLTTTQRKIVIEELVGNVWDSYNATVTQTLKESKNSLYDMTTKTSTIKSELDNILGKVDYIEDRNKRIKDEDISGNDELQAEVSKNIETSNNLQGTYDRDKHTELINRRNKTSAKWTEVSHSTKNYQTLLTQKICPTCNQSYPEDRMSEAKAQVTALQGTQSVLSSKIQKMDETLTGFNNLSGQIQQLNTTIAMIQAKLSVVRETHEEIPEELVTRQAELVSSLEDLSEEVKYWEDRINQLDYLRQLFLPSSKFRTYVVKKYLDIINKEVDALCETLLDGAKIRLVTDSQNKGVEINVSRNSIARAISSFSGGEKAKINLILTLAMQRVHLEFFKVVSNITFLDEIFDGIDQAGITSIVSNLDSIYPPETGIYLISHNRNVKNSLNSVIEIVKENDISVIDYSEYK